MTEIQLRTSRHHLLLDTGQGGVKARLIWGCCLQFSCTCVQASATAVGIPSLDTAVLSCEVQRMVVKPPDHRISSILNRGRRYMNCHIDLHRNARKIAKPRWLGGPPAGKRGHGYCSTISGTRDGIRNRILRQTKC